MTGGEETVVIVCMRSSDPGIRVAGIGHAHCNKCGAQVDVAPSTVQMMESQPQKLWRIACLSCVREQMKTLPIDEPIEVMPPNTAQLAEIREALGL